MNAFQIAQLKNLSNTQKEESQEFSKQCSEIKPYNVLCKTRKHRG